MGRKAFGALVSALMALLVVPTAFGSSRVAPLSPAQVEALVNTPAQTIVDSVRQVSPQVALAAASRPGAVNEVAPGCL